MPVTASPTPAPTFSTGGNAYRRPPRPGLARTTSARQLTRRPSPLSVVVTDLVPSTKVSVADSSDDDDLAPIKLSAEAREILGEDASQTDSPRKDLAKNNREDGNRDAAIQISATRIEERLRLDSASPGASNGSPAPRVVRLGPGARPALGYLGRDGSFLYNNHAATVKTEVEPRHDSISPAPRTRSVRLSGSRNQTRSPITDSPSSESEIGDGSNGKFSEPRSGTVSHAKEEQHKSESDHDHPGPATVVRSRRADENGLQSTTRVRRVGNVAGSFLNGPVRRGMIRRQSEEDDIPHFQEAAGHDDPTGASESQDQDLMAAEKMSESRQQPVSSPVESGRAENQPALSQNHVSFSSSATTVSPEQKYHIPRRNFSPPRASVLKSKSTPASNGFQFGSKSSNTKVEPIFKLPLPALPSAQDQENEPPPTFKRTKPSVSVLGEVHKVIESTTMEKPGIRATPVTVSPRRQPLAPRSQNTPHRAPPPPPKMSVLDAASSNAGSSKKKRPQIVLKGKVFTRLDLLGRGGSSRVYRVMAENCKIFALKRVNLEDADETSIAGYKGEIDLLQKLEKVERVVRLYDFEVNDAKGTLTVLMEMGEMDFNQVLNRQLKTENAKLDISFTRHYWKEMLESVQSVHDYDIVHSDLKPANFVLVQGRLKLIDFGIANAIQDNTVNVHRENQIGTPNYMSPESLVSCNVVGGMPTSTGKLLRLGKPSDVWSLGCILYQMTYGQPPFAHIQKQFERIMSIPNPKVEIQFPPTGVGGVAVPPALIRTLRGCLQRDQTRRPTIRELLSEGDPFLNPDTGDGVVVTPAMLRRMLGSVLNHCRNSQSIPDDAVAAGWQMSFFEKIRQMEAQGTAL